MCTMDFLTFFFFPPLPRFFFFFPFDTGCVSSTPQSLGAAGALVSRAHSTVTTLTCTRRGQRAE